MTKEILKAVGDIQNLERRNEVIQVKLRQRNAFVFVISTDVQLFSKTLLTFISGHIITHSILL